MVLGWGKRVVREGGMTQDEAQKRGGNNISAGTSESKKAMERFSLIGDFSKSSLAHTHTRDL